MKPIFLILCGVVWLAGLSLNTAGQQPELVIQTGHSLGVNEVAFTPDGQMLVSGGLEGTVKLWDVATGKEIRNFVMADTAVEKEMRHLGLGEFINGVAVSGDGARVVSGSSGSYIRVWDIKTGEQLSVIRGPELVTAVAISFDGKVVASVGHESKEIKLWDVATGKEMRTLTGHAGAVDALEFSGKFLFSGSRDMTVKVWDWESGQLVMTQPGYFPDTKVSPDRKVLAGISSTTNREVKLIDIEAGKERATLAGHTFPVTAFAFSPDSRMIATSSADKTIKLWDVGTGRELKTIKSLTFSAGRVVAPADGSVLAVTNLGTGASISQLTSLMTGLDLSGGAGTFGTTVKLFDVRGGRAMRSVDVKQIVSELEFSPDGKMFAVIGAEAMTIEKPGKAITLWDVETGRKIKTLTGHLDTVSSIAFSPNGQLLASYGRDKTARLWSVAGGRLLKTFRGYTDDHGFVSFNTKGTQLESGGPKTVKVHDVKSGRMIISLTGQHAGIRYYKSRRVIAPSRDGQQAASWINESTVTLTDLKTKKVFKYLNMNEATSKALILRDYPEFRTRWDVASSIVFNKWFAEADGSKVDFFDKKTGDRLASLIFLQNDEWAVVTPEGRFDTNKLESPDGLHWILPNARFTPLSFEIFMRDYYEPRLLPRLLRCTEEGNCKQEFKPIRDLTFLNHTQPIIKINKITATASPDTVEVTVEVENAVSKYQQTPEGGRLSSGVYDIRLFRDSQLVGHSTSNEKLQGIFRPYKNFDEELAVWREANRVDLVDGRKAVTFEVKLPTGQQNDRVEFYAYAFNDDRVKSETARTIYTIPASTDLKAKPRVAYVITFGVNKYDNPEWDLRFAGNDARVMRQAVSASLRSQKEFAEIVEIPLISDGVVVDDKVLERRDATKANIEAVFQLLSGRTPPAERVRDLENAIGAVTLQRIRQAKPDDMVLIAFSAHGYADKNGIFYVVPTNIGKDSKKRVTAELLTRSISSDELSLWLRDVDAGEMVMIVDACHATSAVVGSEFKPGPMGSRGLGQLAFDKGMRILTATQSDNVALENNLIKQGLLTYALTYEGIGAHKADYKPKDNVIKISEWLSYGVERVPKLYEEVRARNLQGRGSEPEQWGGGNTASQNAESDDKALEEVILKSKTQQPSLFDFTRHRKEVTLVSVQ